MANDRNDFAPEIRNTAWWASDSRQAVNGKALYQKATNLLSVESKKAVAYFEDHTKK